MKYFLTIVGIAMILASCQREPNEVIEYEPPVVNTPTNPVTGGLVGTIFDEDQSRVEGAIITVHGRQTSSDVNGRFSFENITMYADGTYVKIRKPGLHFSGHKFYAIEGEINIVAIEVIAKEHNITFSSESNDIISEDFVELNMPQGDYLLESNESYNGEILADIVGIPLGSESSSFKTPGDLTGLDENFELKAISNYGIFKIDITSQSGEQLQFPTESSATFNFNFPEVELSQIPNVLSLWFFDEEHGSWLQKGEAIYSSGAFSGEIDRAGFWMLGLPYDYADINGTLVDSNNSFPKTRLDVQNFDVAYLNTFHTTMSGMFLTRVPQSVALDMSIYHECNVGRQIEALGVLDDHHSFNSFQIETEMDNIEILGRITGCNGVNEGKPYLKVNFGEEQFMYRSDDAGNFNFSYFNCLEDEVMIVAIDDKTFSVSEALVLPVHNLIDIGDIETCEEIAAGYDIDYVEMDWSTELASSVVHEWTVSRVTALEDKVIFSVKMIDQLSGELYLTAAFVFVEGETQADFQLNFKSQGFVAFGVCDLEAVGNGAITSYRFSGIGSDITSTDDGVIPQGIEEVNFNLVYYD